MVVVQAGDHGGHGGGAQLLPLRRALGFRTIFNLCGPLTNPAGARAQVIGVLAEQIVSGSQNAGAGMQDLNNIVFMPLQEAQLYFNQDNRVQSIEILGAATRNFAERCVRGIRATERGPEMVERGLAICTGLVPLIGYDAAATIAKQAAKSGRTVREVARETTTLTAEQLDAALDPFKMTEPLG